MVGRSRARQPWVLMSLVLLFWTGLSLSSTLDTTPPGAQQIYVINEADGTVSLIDPARSAVTDTVKVGERLVDLADLGKPHEAQHGAVVRAIR